MGNNETTTEYRSVRVDSGGSRVPGLWVSDRGPVQRQVDRGTELGVRYEIEAREVTYGPVRVIDDGKSSDVG